MKPRVFVVNEPLQRDHHGDWVRKLNLAPAREHGELVHLLPAGQLPSNPQPTIEVLKRGLSAFNSSDALLLVGDMRAIAWATAIAAAKTSGLLRILIWSSAARRYDLSEANVFVPRIHELATMERKLSVEEEEYRDELYLDR